MTKQRKALDEAGAQTKIVSLKSGKVQGMNHMDKGDKFNVDLTLNEARPEEFDALMLPGGLYNPDLMRTNDRAMNFARYFFREGKPVAVICHGPQLLISADLVRGRRMTSWPALAGDMRNAGARRVDEEVVVDTGWVSGGKPDDIPAFNRKMIEEFAEAQHKAAAAA